MVRVKVRSIYDKYDKPFKPSECCHLGSWTEWTVKKYYSFLCDLMTLNADTATSTLYAKAHIIGNYR